MSSRGLPLSLNSLQILSQKASGNALSCAPVPVPSSSSQKPQVKVQNKYPKQQEESLRLQESQMAVKTIGAFEIGLLSYEAMVKLSSFECTVSGFKSEKGTVKDPRFGPINGSEPCQTCGRNVIECTGHYGLINIPPIIHPDFGKSVIYILSSRCSHCGKCYLSEEDIISEGINKKKDEKRYKAIYEIIKKRGLICYNPERIGNIQSCLDKGGVSQREYRPYDKENYLLNYTLEINNSSGKKSKTQDKPQRPTDIFSELSNIPDYEAEKIYGFIPGHHPRDMILKAILVPPLTLRIDYGSKANYLTEKYNSLISFKEQRSQNQINEDDFMKKIQSTVHALIKTGNTRGEKNSNDKAISDFLTGKRGDFREKGEGRTVNNTARAVVSPGAYLPVDTVGVPTYIASKSVVKEIVSPYNVEYLNDLYNKGSIIFVSPIKNSKIHHFKKPVNNMFKEKNPNFKLTLGDTVWRIVMDGDIVLLNRQPTLHKHSMVALYVKIIPNETIEVPPELTGGFNMDFDGDEGNLHFPQSFKARVEAMTLMSVKQLLRREDTGAIIVAMIQDNILTAYFLTMNQEVEEKEFEFEKKKSNIESYYDELILEEEDMKKKEELKVARDNEIKIEKDILKQEVRELLTEPSKVDMRQEIFNEVLNDLIARVPEYYTEAFIEGLKERCIKYNVVWGSRSSLFSLVLPPNFFYSNKKGILIKEGIHIKGTLTVQDVGSFPHNMISQMVNICGGDEYLRFLYHFRILTNTYLYLTNISIGLFDVIPKNYDDVKAKLDSLYEEASRKIKQQTEIVPNTKIQEELIETKINGILSLPKRVADTQIPSTYDPSNPLRQTATSGSKGGPTNLAQMLAFVGSQTAQQKRIQPSLPGERTVPYVFPKDTSPESKGFVRESFFTGLDLISLFLHALSVRYNLTELASNVPALGYLMRKMVKKNEALIINTNGSVINQNSQIIQPVFGGSGFSASNVSYEEGNGFSVMNLQDLADVYFK